MLVLRSSVAHVVVLLAFQAMNNHKDDKPQISITKDTLLTVDKVIANLVWYEFKVQSEKMKKLVYKHY